MSIFFKNNLVKNTSWTALSFMVVSVVYLLRISVLTRFMSREDFGLIALALFILGFTNIFSDLGVSTVILSKDRLSRKEYSSLYWVGLILAIALYFILLFITPFFADFYESHELKVLIPIMGLDLMISTSGRQFNTYLQKELKFKKIAIIKIFSELISFGLAIILAVNNFGIWSLVFSLLTASFLNALGSILFEYKEHPLKLYCNIKETKHLYGVGLYQTGAQILDYLSSQIDILLLGRLLPMGDMGTYSIIKTLVVKVYSSINQVFTKVSVPILARIQFDVNELKIQYLSIIKIIAILNAFVFLIIIVNSEFILQLFYGKEFENYGYILSILGIWGYFSALVNCAAGIIIATGKTKVGFLWTQVRLVMNPLFIFIGAYFGGILGVCISQAVYSVFVLFVYQKIVIKRIISIVTIIDLFSCFRKVLFVSVILYSLFYILDYSVSNIALFQKYTWIYFVGSSILITFFYYVLQKKEIVLNLKKFKV